MSETQRVFDLKTKPRGSLGTLETLAVRIGALQDIVVPPRPEAAIVVAAADHGVAAEGVSAYPQEVTAQMVANFAAGGAAINVLAREAGARLVVVDAGVAVPCVQPEVRALRFGAGTASITRGPAMRHSVAEAAVEAIEPPRDEAGFGIPEPHLVDAPGETWRSRFDGKRWEVNQMHDDYLALKGESRSRLRYLLALLAKDLAQHAHRVPGAVEASEDVASILALAERNLRGA